RGHALLGPPRAAPPGRLRSPPGRGDAGGLQPRGFVGRLLARRERPRGADVLLLRLPRATGLPRVASGTFRGSIRRAARRIPPPLRGGAHLRRSGGHLAPLPTLDLRGGRELRRLAPRGA